MLTFQLVLSAFFWLQGHHLIWPNILFWAKDICSMSLEHNFYWWKKSNRQRINYKTLCLFHRCPKTPDDEQICLFACIQRLVLFPFYSFSRQCIPVCFKSREILIMPCVYQKSLLTCLCFAEVNIGLSHAFCIEWKIYFNYSTLTWIIFLNAPAINRCWHLYSGLKMSISIIGFL